MNQTLNSDQIKFHHCSVAAAGPYPRCDFNLRDNRYDPIVGVALQALTGALGDDQNIATTTGIISLTDSGCQSHVKRVAEALVQMRPRQAFFARASAVMLSTYGSLALASHGPCFSLSGGATAMLVGLSVAKRFLSTAECERIIFMAADQEHEMLNGSAVIFSPAHLTLLDELIKSSHERGFTNMSPSSLLRLWFTQDLTLPRKATNESEG